MRHALGQREELVDLLLVLGEHQLGLAVIEEVGGFLVQHVAIEAEAQAPDRVRCDLGSDPVGTVIADDADDVAAAKSELDHAEREVAYAGLVIVPGEQPPEPEILLAQRDLVAMFLGVEAQELWVGVCFSEAGIIIHHASLSARGASSGSTSTSSSSPR